MTTVHEATFGGARMLVNIAPTETGAIRAVEPDRNAVIVDIIPVPQEDGSIKNSRVIWIMCKDEEMRPALEDQARILLANLT
jgi:hypothetical protein